MKQTRRMVLAALFMGMGLVLPFLTGQVPYIGKMLLPMHLPVLLCGMVCGWQYGLVVGVVMPLLRSALFSAPALYPTALLMAVELAAYGALVGLFYRAYKNKNWLTVYGSLIPAMMGGRLIKGVFQAILLGVGGDGFTVRAFVAGSFVNALPGILLQLVLVPMLMLAIIRREKHYTT